MQHVIQVYMKLTENWLFQRNCLKQPSNRKLFNWWMNRHWPEWPNEKFRYEYFKNITYLICSLSNRDVSGRSARFSSNILKALWGEELLVHLLKSRASLSPKRIYHSWFKVSSEPLTWCEHPILLIQLLRSIFWENLLRFYRRFCFNLDVFKHYIWRHTIRGGQLCNK